MNETKPSKLTDAVREALAKKHEATRPTTKTKKNKVITTLQQGNQSESKKDIANKVTKIKADTKNYDGHRQRVREKFLKTPQTCGYQTYELIEMLLFYCNKRSDVKPLAKELLHKFGNFRA